MKYKFVFWSAVRYRDRLGGRTREFADRLARQGHDVVFVEMPTLGNFARNFRDGFSRSDGCVQSIVAPLPLPGFTRLWSSLFGRLWSAYVRRLVRARISFDENTVSIVSTPAWVPVITGMDIGTICYDCIDHVRVHSGSGAEGLFSDWDDALLERSCLVTVVSKRLADDLSHRFDAARIYLLQNGVRDEWACPERGEEAKAPVPSRKRVAGFIGAIFEWVDLELLQLVARKLPDWDIVLVGPKRRGINLDVLVDCPNVTWVGPKPPDEVPEWISRFDVCLIPFKRDIVADCADPIKLYEYSAFGKPVVSTVDFVPDGCLQAPCFTVAEDADAFARAVKDARLGPDQIACLENFGAANTWNQRVESFVSMVDSVVKS